MAIPLTSDTDSQKRIVEITEGMKDLLLYKNKSMVIQHFALRTDFTKVTAQTLF